MPTNPDTINRLAFSTRCLPGSPAEQQETERIAEFQRCKSAREAQEEIDRPDVQAKRHAEYLAGSEENKELTRKKRAGYSTYAVRVTGQLP